MNIGKHWREFLVGAAAGAVITGILWAIEASRGL